MNPGPVEEVGKVAGGIVESLRAQPMILALVLMNIGLLLLLWRVAIGVSETREREVKLLYENQKTVQELLARCVVPPPRG